MKIAVVLATCIAALLAAPASAQETQPTTIRFTFPIFDALINPCNGETVVVRGEATALIHTNVDDAGGSHTTFVVHATELTATAPNGTPLDLRVIMRDSQSAQQSASGGVFTTTQTAQVLIISPDSEPNAVVHAVFHLTFVEGEPTATVEFLRIDCTG